jgi:hypothetical protein
MQHASRIAIVGLLTLLQLFAPLVHAHVGGGQFSGVMHVPGLEFLARVHGKSAQACTHTAGPEVIVGWATGRGNRGDETNANLETGFNLPPNLILVSGLPSDSASRFPIFHFSPPRTFWLGSVPRAPPVTC